MHALLRKRWLLLPLGVGAALAWQMMWIFRDTPVIHGAPWDLGTVRIAVGSIVLLVFSGIAALALQQRKRSSKRYQHGMRQWGRRSRWFFLCAAIGLIMLCVAVAQASRGLLAVAWMVQWCSIVLAVATLYQYHSVSLQSLASLKHKHGDQRVDTLFPTILLVFCGMIVLNACFVVAQAIVQETTLTSALLNINPRLLDDPGTAKVLGPQGAFIRPYGWFVHPNIMGAYGVIGCVGSWLLLSTSYRWMRVRIPQWAVHMVGGWTLAASVLMVVLSFSRTAWVAAVAGVVGLAASVAWEYARRRELIDIKGCMIGCVVMVATLGIVGSAVWPLVLGRFAGSEIERGGDRHREQLYALSVEMVQDHVWMGVGPAQFTAAAQEYRPSWSGSQLAPVHNTPLLVLVEWGVVGVSGWVLLGGVVVRLWIRRFGRLPLVAAFLPPLMVMAWFDMYLYQFWPGMALVAWILLIILTFSTRPGGKHS